MSSPTIELSRDGSVAWLHLNRPAQYNALDWAMLRQGLELFRQITNDDTIRVIVLRGRGKAFCTGADLACVQEARGSRISGAGFGDFLALATEFSAALRQLPMPVIAAVNGVATAGGLEIAMACDLIVAAESARMGDCHANFGLIPGGGGATVLPRLIGAKRAKWLLYRGALLDAAVLRDWGLVNAVFADSVFDTEVSTLAREIAAKSSPSLSRIKVLVDETSMLTIEEAITQEVQSLIQHSTSADVEEGLSAFVEKRPPVFRDAPR